MTTLRIEKVDTSLPGTLTPNTLYFVKNGSTVTTYITDGTGTTAYPTNAGGAVGDNLHPFLLMGAGNGF